MLYVLCLCCVVCVVCDDDLEQETTHHPPPFLTHLHVCNVVSTPHVSLVYNDSSEIVLHPATPVLIDRHRAAAEGGFFWGGGKDEMIRVGVQNNDTNMGKSRQIQTDRQTDRQTD